MNINKYKICSYFFLLLGLISIVNVFTKSLEIKGISDIDIGLLSYLLGTFFVVLLGTKIGLMSFGILDIIFDFSLIWFIVSFIFHKQSKKLKTKERNKKGYFKKLILYFKKFLFQQSELEDKRWYRLARLCFIVISISLIVFSLTIGLFVYDKYAPYRVYEDAIIKCDSGKEFKVKEIINSNNLISISTRIKEINNKCELNTFALFDLSDNLEKKYHVFMPYHTKGSYFNAIAYGGLTCIGLFILSVFIIWITHKTMLYIIYGRKN